MMRLMKYILFAVILLLTASCMKEINLDHLKPTPKLVLNCIVIEGEPIKTTLTRTWFYSEGCPNTLLYDADVKLYINDQYVEQLTMELDGSKLNTFGYYVSSSVAASGDKVRLEAELDGFKAVASEDVITKKTALLDFDCEIEESNSYGSTNRYYNNIYKIKFKDDPSVTNCYLIRFIKGYPVSKIDTLNPDEPAQIYYNWNNESVDFTSDPVFDSKISILDKVMGNDWLSGFNGRSFSDELFNGTEYTMKLKSSSSYGFSSYHPESGESLPDSIRVYLYSISESYYKYLEALSSLYDPSLNNDLAEIGLAEPIRVFSNIEGGLGIFGTACVDSMTMAIPVPKSN